MLSDQAVGSEPYVFLIHGAYHGGWCWEKVQILLRNWGIESTTVDLPIDDPAAGYREYSQMAESACPPDKRPVVVCHSMGGLLGPGIARRLGATALVYVAGAVARAGWSWAKQVRSEGVKPVGFESWEQSAARSLLPSPGWSYAREVFFGGLSEREARANFAQLRPQGSRLLEEIATDDWCDFPLSSTGYMICNRDKSIRPDWQRRVSAKMSAGVFELSAGHEPFFEVPQELAQVLKSFATERR
jgi:pimeloyl-ACP methyl ester carboxylesterase